MPAPWLLANNAFDDDTTSRLSVAYEAAWRKLKASGSPLAEKSHAASTRERLAACILEIGQRGETDSSRLVERALGRLTSLNGAALASLTSSANCILPARALSPSFGSVDDGVGSRHA